MDKLSYALGLSFVKVCAKIEFKALINESFAKRCRGNVRRQNA